VFGVPPELIGDHEHATYSNIESAMKSLWTDTLIPEASMIADELTEQLVPLFGNEADEVEFDLSDIETLQEDRSEVIDQVVKLVGVGVPLNRALQELAPRFLPPEGDGFPWGNAAWLPSGLTPVTGDPLDNPPPLPPALPVATVEQVAIPPPTETRSLAGTALGKLFILGAPPPKDARRR